MLLGFLFIQMKNAIRLVDKWQENVRFIPTRAKANLRKIHCVTCHDSPDDKDDDENDEDEVTMTITMLMMMMI